MADLTTAPQDQNKNYTNSKTGSWFLAAELGREVRPLGILSITQNPGNLKTNLFRHTSKWYQWAISPLLYSAKMGAYTELWAGLSSEVAMEIGGGYVVPFGRMHSSARKDLLDALRSVEDLGTGQAGQFRAWCEKQTVEYR